MIILFISLQKKDMMDTVKNRRTIRKYQQKDITPDLLNDLLETSFRASTMGGMRFIVWLSPVMPRKRNTFSGYFNQPMVRRLRLY